MKYTPPKISKIDNAKLLIDLQAKLNNKTKPVGSLGRIEDLACKLGEIQETLTPKILDPQLVVYAGDHGIVAQGVSAYPSDVTWQMVENFIARGAAVSVLAKQHNISMTVVDCGVNHDFPERPSLLLRKVGRGTADSTQQAAMSSEEVLQCLHNGEQIVRDLPGNVFILGEMGIGNTSAASLLFSKLADINIEKCTGSGTGLSAEAVDHKTEVLRRALHLHKDLTDPIDILAALGGFEIATMVGSILAAAAERRLILIDGFIVTAALMVATKLEPAVLDYCVFAHQSGEKGHILMLDYFKRQPLLNLGLRLGEGSGAMIAWPLLVSACMILNEMASFDTAGVSRETDS